MIRKIVSDVINRQNLITVKPNNTMRETAKIIRDKRIVI